MNSKILNGKNVLITGATGGLGIAIAHQLASAQCNLFLTGKKVTKLKNIKYQLQKYNIKVHICCANLAKVSDIRRLVYKALHAYKRIDILINCAGVFPIASIEKTTLSNFQKCFAVNIQAPFLLTKQIIPNMIKNKWGRIINIGSSSAFNGFKNTSIYCASKHALLGFSRAMFDELKEKNIRVISINPGTIRTKMGKKLVLQDPRSFINPNDVAKYLAFACSFDSEMVSEEIRLNRFYLK